MSNLIEKEPEVTSEDADMVSNAVVADGDPVASDGADKAELSGIKQPADSEPSESSEPSDKAADPDEAKPSKQEGAGSARGIGIGTTASSDKKKDKSSSLVERAALMSGTNPFNRPIGKVGEAQRRDPSSMNPIAAPPPAPSFRGIGGSGGPKKKAPETDGAENASDSETNVTSQGFSAVSAPVKKPSALERMAEANKKAEAPLVQKKERKSRPPQEIDLVALREAGYITPDMPPNLMSEEFRIIKRSLLLHAFSKGKARSKNSNVMLVTSSNPSEGKTFCTINLALSIATEQDITVLLVDADFSKPEILNRLGVNGGRGLMDVVADDSIDVGECLIRTNVPNLVLLPAGRQHNLTTELLASERMESMVEEIATRYPDRLVIFDSPPVLASSAASVLALYMGQTVFVIEAEQTTEPQIKESLSMISACENINLLLNKTRYNGSNQKFASYYGYGGR